ncbi:MAG: deoxyribodipyrimidine photo-lyase [Mariprofundus sp.]|nr:deoxyribodipyrimidine photo-lyase [Mariprofundus sp.]
MTAPSLIYRHALVCLRRDLRLHDNTALLAALRQSLNVSLCFVLDPEQTVEHAWHSSSGLAFMLESLLMLDDELAELGSGLTILQGNPEDALAEACDHGDFDALYLNLDYTPFAIRRDAMIMELCERRGIPLHTSHDALLTIPGEVLTGSDKPYQVFTPFHRTASALPVAMPQSCEHACKLAPTSVKLRNDHRQILLAHKRRASPVAAGRGGAMTALDQLAGLQDYQTTRDLPALDATSHLSVHLKFGTLSVREAYHAMQQYLDSTHPLLRQLYWRDFFSHIVFHHPHVFGSAFQQRFDNIEWRHDEHHFDAWCTGKTGFPIVDAGMRELRQTGFMHNRVRMITASFLVKDLHIDWRWGEAWFARHLVDYDPAVNNGNWQWAASTGCDAQPWFRIFNPWLQQKRFDSECVYIKRWLPELAGLSTAAIHQWQKHPLSDHAYPQPIVDHATQSRLAKAMFKSAHDKETVNDHRL